MSRQIPDFEFHTELLYNHAKDNTDDSYISYTGGATITDAVTAALLNITGSAVPIGFILVWCWKCIQNYSMAMTLLLSDYGVIMIDLAAS